MIKDATDNDRDVLVTIIRESFRDVALRFSLTGENCPKHPSQCTSDWIESDMARGVQYFILSDDGKPVGCVGVERSSEELCYLERLSVLPEMRGRHWGVRLVHHVLRWAALNDVRRVGIGIIDEHTELKTWYKKLGFAEIEIKRYSHLPFTVCLMECDVEKTAGLSVK